jgi:hypothetical protein
VSNKETDGFKGVAEGLIRMSIRAERERKRETETET